MFDADNSTVSSELGSLSIAADGTWTYTVNNDAVQYLDANESETVTYTIPTADGADTETITITINGAEDDSEITLETGDSDTGSVTEDVAVTDGNLTTTGSVTLTDADGD
ncbi:VCBS domain-containing protein, partial [Vibrio sp. 10N.222.54.F6]